MRHSHILKVMGLFFALFMLFFTLVGCTKVSKTNFISSIRHMDYHNSIQENVKKCGRLSSCFIISRQKYNSSMDKIIDECIEREEKNYPKMLGYSEKKSFIKNLNICIENKFIRRHRKDFTFDKSPECLDLCKKIRKKLDTFKNKTEIKQ